MIEIKNLFLVKRKKAKEAILLKNISLEIPTGKISLVLGKSGSGKTSILRCISQIEREYTGEILFKGKSMDTLTRKERCQVLGFVPQSYALFPFMSVLDNCAHPLRTILGYSKKEAYERAEEKLSSLEMHKLLHSFPHELSGGQQQRASIVRALLLNPTFLLLDEPTSALDPENTNLLIQIIFQLKAEGKGVAISSQDMFFARKMLDRVYFLEGGELVENHDVNNTPLSQESKLHQFLSQTQSV